MSFPCEPVEVPEVVAGMAAARPVAAVWINELGGVTFRIDGGAGLRQGGATAAMLSLSWNHAGDFGAALFDAYRVEPDPQRVDFYRALWNAGDVSSH